MSKEIELKNIEDIYTQLLIEKDNLFNQFKENIGDINIRHIVLNFLRDFELLEDFKEYLLMYLEQEFFKEGGEGGE